mmetsp:Transcript_19336/g.26829  ORF Transcript_19336/g.26829 Transcript_19336/m.26829 type:complete len:340 (-) Transcript_19336:61-1080(-)
MSQQQVIRNKDLLALQAYVTAKDETIYDNLHKDTVVLDLTHSNLLQRHIEVRFDLHDTIGDVKSKIYQKTGTPSSFQHLQLKRGGMIVMEIPSEQAEQHDSKMLGYFGIQHGMEIHCVDVNPHSGSKNGQYENTALVEKYRMTEEEYDKRKGTLRDWERRQKEKDANFTLAKHAREHREMVEARRQHKLGLALPDGFDVDCTGKVVRVAPEHDANETKDTAAEKSDVIVPGPESVQGKEVGMRCEVQPGGRRGQVAFVGEVPEIGGGGYWIGVLFDEPVGKTDGRVTVKSKNGETTKKRYFDAMPGYASFLRGEHVQAGNYPERDIMDELNSDDSEDEL